MSTGSMKTSGYAVYVSKRGKPLPAFGKIWYAEPQRFSLEQGDISRVRPGDPVLVPPLGYFEKKLADHDLLSLEVAHCVAWFFRACVSAGSYSADEVVIEIRKYTIEINHVITDTDVVITDNLGNKLATSTGDAA